MSETDTMTPRLTIANPTDAILIVESLAAYGFKRMQELDDQAKRYRAVGKMDESTECLAGMVALTEQVTQLIELARTEIDTAKANREADSDDHKEARHQSAKDVRRPRNRSRNV